MSRAEISCGGGPAKVWVLEGGKGAVLMKFDLDDYVALGPFTETEAPKLEDSKGWCCWRIGEEPGAQPGGPTGDAFGRVDGVHGRAPGPAPRGPVRGRPGDQH